MRVLSVSAKRYRVSSQSRDLWPHLLAWGLVLLYIVTFTWLAVQRHHTFLSGFDLGVYNQVVWNTLQGRIFFYTSTGEPLLHLSNHADPILLLLAPFYLIYSGPEMLLFLQAGLIGLAGLPLFWLGRDKLGSNLAGLALLSAYLLFPGTEVVALSDFHPPVLAFGFLMFAFYFLEKRKSGWFLLFVILAMACKEQIPLQVIFLGLYAIVWRRNWWLGLTTVTLGAAWFVAVMYWVIPTYSVTGDHIFLNFYAAFGGSPLEIILTVLTRPDLVLKNLWAPAKLAYLYDIFIPFIFLPLAGLPVLLIGLPSFAINLLSANPAMQEASRGHYVADVTPWLAWGALFGLLYLRRGMEKIWPKGGSQTTTVMSLSLVAVALAWHVFHGFSPLAFNYPTWEVTDHDRLAQRFLDQIPPDRPISAQGRLYAHLSRRPIAYVFPQIFEAEYIFLDVTADTSPLHPNNQFYEVRKLLKSGEFGVLDAADGYILLKRGLDKPDLPDAFYDFARRAEIAPQHPTEVTFGHDLKLLGFDLVDDPRRQETAVRLYWQVLRSLEDELQLYPFFVNAAGEVIEDTSLRPMTTQIWYPPQNWRPGEYVTSQTLPWTLGDEWSLAVGVLAGDNWSQWNRRLKVQLGPKMFGARRFETNTWVRLATFQRQLLPPLEDALRGMGGWGGRDLVEVAPVDLDLVPPNILQANLDNKMKLLGYDLTQTGREVDLTLYWEALANMGYDYTIFVHVVDEAGRQVAQQDSQPWWDVSIPTTTWQPGEKLRDHHTFTLPADLPPGRYQLRLGAYYWQTLERLPVLEDGRPVNNFVDLGPILGD